MRLLLMLSAAAGVRAIGPTYVEVGRQGRCGAMDGSGAYEVNRANMTTMVLAKGECDKSIHCIGITAHEDGDTYTYTLLYSPSENVSSHLAPTEVVLIKDMPNSTELCSDWGTSTTINDTGYADAPHGYYDFYNCGICNVYCRWTGDSSPGALSPVAEKDQQRVAFFNNKSVFFTCDVPDDAYAPFPYTSTSTDKVNGNVPKSCDGGREISVATPPRAPDTTSTRCYKKTQPFTRECGSHAQGRSYCTGTVADLIEQGVCNGQTRNPPAKDYRGSELSIADDGAHKGVFLPSTTRPYPPQSASASETQCFLQCQNDSAVPVEAALLYIGDVGKGKDTKIKAYQEFFGGMDAVYCVCKPLGLLSNESGLADWWSEVSYATCVSNTTPHATTTAAHSKGSRANVDTGVAVAIGAATIALLIGIAAYNGLL